MARFDTDVFVVGGGPAGLAAAIAAQLQGMRVIVADSAEAPIDKCCGEGILPDGAAALRQLGVAIPSEAGRFYGIRFFDQGRMAEGRFAGAGGFGIRRTLLGQLLLARALETGVECRFSTRVIGIASDGVQLDGEFVRARWIVGADGFRSRVRRWADLHAGAGSQQTRCGFRRHFEIERAPDYVEVHWRDGFQVFVTPVDAHEVSVAMTTGDPAMRLDEALEQLPELQRKLGAPVSTERGAITGNMSLRAVFRDNVALAGDASGAVDSITGEGLRLAFRQSLHLAAAMADENLAAYGEAHRTLAWRPRMMANALLWLARHSDSRHTVVRMLKLYPPAFRMMLPTRAVAATPLTVPTGKGVLMRLSISLLLFAWALQAQPVHLELDPGHTKVEYTVKSTLHTVHGTFALKSGRVDYDAKTGSAGGEIVVDATSGDSGSDARDHRMNKAILECAEFSEIKFVPDHVEAQAPAEGAEPVLQLHGRFWLHGTPHEMVIAATVHQENGLMKITSGFQVPYVEWGLKNPSMFLLKVNDTVDVHIDADAKIAGD